MNKQCIIVTTSANRRIYCGCNRELARRMLAIAAVYGVQCRVCAVGCN